jgi:hypothetical protein
MNAETHYYLPVTEYALKAARASDHQYPPARRCQTCLYNELG